MNLVRKNNAVVGADNAMVAKEGRKKRHRSHLSRTAFLDVSQAVKWIRGGGREGFCLHA